MALWVDKHRPKRIGKCTFHPELSETLQKVVKSDGFPHLLFFGPAGAGKNTRVLAVLRELFGSSCERIRLEHKSFKIRSRTIELTTVASNHHIEMCPADAGVYDRVVVQDIIKEIASARTLESGSSKRGFKVVVLKETDRLSKDAQQALRRTMERYSSTCRLILCCESVSRVIDPLRSRCLAVRVPAPTHDDIVDCLQAVARKETLNVIPDRLAAAIAVASRRNARRAVLMLETAYVQQYPWNAAQKPQLPDWERVVEEIARTASEEQTPQKLLEIRGKFYDLLVHCIPPDVIVRHLVEGLMRTCDDSLKHEICRWAAHYEHRLHKGNKPIMHLEAFTCRFMSIYKQWLDAEAAALL